MICGLEGRFERHLRDVRQIIGSADGVATSRRSVLLITQRGAIFLTDTYVTVDPTAEEIAEMTRARRRGNPPLRHRAEGRAAVALRTSARAMRRARCKMREALRHPAQDRRPISKSTARCRATPRCRKRCASASCRTRRCTGEANLLVFPNLDAANITLDLVKQMTDALHVGPILLGAAQPAHILTPSVTSRGVVNMTALAVVEASQPPYPIT